MLNLNFDPFPVLTTQRFLLRRVAKSDVEEMFVMRSDPRILPHRVPITLKEEVLAYIEKLDTEQANGNSITWAIQHKDDSKLLGTVCIWNIQPQHDRAEIGYALLTEHHRKGIMTEVLPTVLKFGFDVMKLHSVEGHVGPYNSGSIKVLERNGFVREGYFKQNFKLPNGTFDDTAVYSLLAPTR